VMVGNDCFFIMIGGNIEGNTVGSSSWGAAKGGGVYGSGSMTLGGKVKVANNLNSTKTAENLYLKDQQTVTISKISPLISGASIGITTITAPTTDNPVNITGNNSADYSSYFVSDNTTSYSVSDKVEGTNHIVQLILGSGPGPGPEPEPEPTPVIDDKIVIPDVPDVQVVKDISGKTVEVITAKGNAYEDGSSVIIENSSGTDNVQIIITNASIEEGAGGTDTVKLGSNSEISIVYPEKKSGTNDGGSSATYQITMPVNDIVTNLPTVTGAFSNNVSKIVKNATDADAIAMITASENTAEINAAMTDGFAITMTIPASLVVDSYNLEAFHVTSSGTVERAEISYVQQNINNSGYVVQIKGTTYSSYVLANSKGSISSTKNSSSIPASFRGEKVGNDFVFDTAVVVTEATLPGATSARITNNGSGDGWYKFILTTDRFAGNGTLYFQVPLDVIRIKGWTINDVSLFGNKTTYLSTDGQYAKYSATVNKDGTYTIGFEKDAAAKQVTTTPVTESVKPVEVSVELSGVSAMKVGDTTLFSAKNSDGSSAKFAWKSSDDSVATIDENGTVKALKAGTATITVTNNITGKTATKTITVAAKAEPEKQQTTKSPFPVLGILAGIGAAGVLVMRRK